MVQADKTVVLDCCEKITQLPDAVSADVAHPIAKTKLAEDVAKERAATARERRAAGREASRVTVSYFQSHATKARHGSMPLPDMALANIMTHLVNFLEPAGVWGPSLVARDLAAVALVRD
eukprot:gene2043-2365_t